MNTTNNRIFDVYQVIIDINQKVIPNLKQIGFTDNEIFQYSRSLENYLILDTQFQQFTEDLRIITHNSFAMKKNKLTQLFIKFKKIYPKVMQNLSDIVHFNEKIIKTNFFKLDDDINHLFFQFKLNLINVKNLESVYLSL